jgi:ABC-type uncharacterized transport system auxiliary subunit
VKKALCLAVVFATMAGCDNTPPATDASPLGADIPAATQQAEVAKQKLTIEQAAEKATKLIEADAKAEIDAAEPTTTEPAQ